MSSLLVPGLEEEVDRLLAELDPALLSTADAARLLADVERLVRKLDAAKLRLASRAEDAEEWRAKGFRSPEAWLAQLTGTGIGPATRMFETARQLDELPTTADALAGGELSVDQAAEVAAAAAIDPAAEERLIETARRDGLAGVRKEAERVKAAAMDLEEQHRRAHRRRHLRKIPGRVGELAFVGSTTTDRGAQFWTAVQQEAKRLFEAARASGEHETQDAYMLDGLLNLVLNKRETGDGGNGGDSRRPPRPDRSVFVRVDHTLLDPNADPTHNGNGGACEIVGAGPVPPAAVRTWLADSDVWVLFHQAGQVERVIHLGRAVTEAQRVALYERARFKCEIEHCTISHGLEIDHITGWSVTGRTQLDDLALLCHHHHYKKTYLGYTLTGPPGRRKLEPPPQATPAAAD